MDIRENLRVYLQSRQNPEKRERLFENIWSEYHKRVLYFIRSLVKADKGTCEDLLQEIMLKVYNGIDSYNPLYAFSTWLYTIARNHCLNFLTKKRKPHAELSDDTITADERHPEHQVIGGETHRAIENALNSLPAEDSQICFLRFFENLPCREIADIMDIPLGTVKYKIHEAKKKLKKALEVWK